MRRNRDVEDVEQFVALIIVMKLLELGVSCDWVAPLVFLIPVMRQWPYMAEHSVAQTLELSYWTARSTCFCMTIVYYVVFIL